VVWTDKSTSPVSKECLKSYQWGELSRKFNPTRQHVEVIDLTDESSSEGSALQVKKEGKFASFIPSTVKRENGTPATPAKSSSRRSTTSPATHTGGSGKLGGEPLQSLGKIGKGNAMREARLRNLAKNE
jgi:hypothetical protein